MKLSLIGGLSLALLLAFAQSVHAQAATTPPEYEVVLSQSLEAHARGDYEAARIFMERAHVLEPSARTLRGLGIVAFAQGRHLVAIRNLEQALASAVKPLPPELRRSVEELLESAWSQVGRYEVHVDPPTGDVLVDGAAPDYYAPRTVVLTPGLHVLTARAPARAPHEMQLDVRAGTRETLRLVLAVPPAPIVIQNAPVAPAVAAPRGEARAQDPGTWWTPKWRYLTLASGVTLAVGGAALWLAGSQKLDEIADACRALPEGKCARSEARRRYDAAHIRGYAIASGVLLGSGAAVLLGGAGIELWQWRRQERSLRAQLTPDALLVRGTF